MEFNNNNYLPAFPRTGGAAMPSSMYAQVASPHFGGPLSHTGFTFTSPTQCITTSTPRPSIQAFSPMCNMKAPGVGTSWQHSVPTSRKNITRSSPPPQGRRGISPQFNGFHSQQNYQHSKPIKNVKRKASEEAEGAPNCKVHLCLNKLSQLRISPKKQKKGESGVDYKDRDSHWKHFQEVENSLEEELDLEVTEMSLEPKSDKDQGPIIQIADGVIQVDQTQPILPRQVVEQVQKPCMQLVLWQSPGSTIRDVLAARSSAVSPTSTPPQANLPTHNCNNNRTLTHAPLPSTSSSTMETMEVHTDCDQPMNNLLQNQDLLYSVPQSPFLFNESSLNLSNVMNRKTSSFCAGAMTHAADVSSLIDLDMQS